MPYPDNFDSKAHDRAFGPPFEPGVDSEYEAKFRLVQACRRLVDSPWFCEDMGDLAGGLAELAFTPPDDSDESFDATLDYRREALSEVPATFARALADLIYWWPRQSRERRQGLREEVTAAIESIRRGDPEWKW